MMQIHMHSLAESTNKFVEVSFDQPITSVECKFMNYGNTFNQTECGIVFGPHGSCDITSSVMNSSSVSMSDTVVVKFGTHNLPSNEHCFIVTASVLSVNDTKTVKVEGIIKITSEPYIHNWHIMSLFVLKCR